MKMIMQIQRHASIQLHPSVDAEALYMLQTCETSLTLMEM